MPDLIECSGGNLLWRPYDLSSEKMCFHVLLKFSTESAIQNYSTVLYIVLLHDVVDAGYCLQMF